MSVYSDAARNAFLAGFFGDDNTVGATLYIGLSSTEPTVSSGALTGITEPTTGSYARVAVTNDDTKWTISEGVAENAASIAFPEATADWDEDVSYAVVFTASTGGTALCATDALTGAPVTVTTGETAQFDAGDLTFTHTN